MKTTTFYSVLLLILISIQVNAQQGQPSNLKCEYLVNPIGIDGSAPRLHWQLGDEREGARQSGYQVIVGTDSTEVAKGMGNCWKSKKIKSADQLVTYRGKALQPFTKYYWMVTVWD